MKILVLNYEFPPVGGGGGRVCQEICSGLAKRGHDVKLHTSWIKGLKKRETISGFEVYRSFAFRQRPDRCSVWEMALYVICSFFPVLKLALREKPDCIHAHFAVPTGVVACLVSFFTKIPYVITAHLGDVPGGVPEQTDRLFKYLNSIIGVFWRRAFACTGVSRFVADLGEKSYGVPVQVIHNGIDFSSLQDNRIISVSVSRPVKLLFVGRFNPQKNLPFLIDILKSLQSTDWEANLVGEGPDFETVKELLHASPIAHKVVLHGWKKPEEIKGIMETSDILLLPSLSEGLPMVGVEALGYGLCLVGSEIDGLKDIIGNGINGYLCALNRKQDFVDRLEELFHVESGVLLSMKQASLKKSRAFNMDDILDSYEAIFKSVK